MKSEKLIEQAYYLNSEMVKFLIIDNLALKTLLNEKGLLTPDDFKKHQEAAAQILDGKFKEKVKEWENDPNISSLIKEVQDG